jgi:biofilm protein TabA
MALFGSIATVRAQLAHAAHFEATFRYLDECFQIGSPAHRRLLAVGEGKTERIDLSGGAFALEQAYQTKVRSEGFFESHRAFIDVQVIVEGEELIEVSDVNRLKVTEDFTPARDLIKYELANAASVLRISAGQAAVFFPIDGHMPSLALALPGLVRKTVVKVPVIV